MSSELLIVDRAALQAELQKAFDPHASLVLAGMLERVAGQVYAAGVTREDFRELRQIIGELAAAQTRTEDHWQQLASSQRETGNAVRELTVGLDRMRKDLGVLDKTISTDIVDLAATVLYDVLQREFGWKLETLDRSWEKWGDEAEEVTLFGMADDPARPTTTIWIVGEADYTLTIKQVRKFAKQVTRAHEYLAGEIFPVCFCRRARPEVQEAVQAAGLRLVFSYGKLV